MEPTVVLTLVSSFVELAKGSGDAAALIAKSLPETERFWRHLESKLKNDSDVPWASIRSRSYLHPTFVALSYEMIHGLEGSRTSMRAHFDSFIEPIPGGRYEKGELVARVMTAAEEAATEAATSDRLAALTDRRLVEERVAAAVEELLSELGPLRPELQGVGRDVQAIVEQLRSQADEHARLARGVEERIGRLTDVVEEGARQPASPTRSSIDRDEVRRLLEEQADAFQRRTEDTLMRMFQHPDDVVKAQLDSGGSEQGADQSAIEPVRISHSAAHQEYLAQFEALHRDTPELATRLNRAYGEGVVSLATALREGMFRDGPPALLAAIGQILAKTKFLDEAETAFLTAAQLAVDPRDKTRQLVRTSAMASLQRSSERARQYLDEARKLVPDHPAVLIAEARASSDSQFILEHIDGVEPESALERAILHQTRAQAMLQQGNDEDAQAEFALAQQAAPENDIIVEFGAVLSMAAARRRMEKGEIPDSALLNEAARALEELAIQVGEAGRPDEAAQLVARTAEAFTLASEPAQASRVLESVSNPSSLTEESALYLGDIAGMVGRADLVLKFVPSDADATHARLLRADAEAQSKAPERRNSAVQVLKTLLADVDADVSRRAAFALLSASVEFEDVGWDDAAAAIVARHKADIEVAMRAERALLLHEYGEAQRLLLPQADRTVSLRRLRDYAALAGEWEKAKDRCRELIRREHDPRDRLAMAEAFRKLNERSEAVREFTQLARDGALHADIREAAFRALAEMVADNRDYEALRTTSEEWYEALPASANAAWNLLFALARLSRHADAWALLRAKKLAPDTESRAALYGEILTRAAPRADALGRLIAVSDQFDRRIEAVEALIIMTSLDADAEDAALDEAIQRRVQETFNTFSQRFPNSRMIRAIPAPETPEEIERFFTELAGDTPKLQYEISKAIVAGRAPVSALAAVSNGSVGREWSRMRGLPIGFAMPERDAADRDAARNALGGAAVWDPSSLFVTYSLGEGVMDSMRSLLPGSMVVTETLEDIDSDDRSPGTPSAETLHSPAGAFGVRDIPMEEADREKQRVDAMLRAVRRLDVRPALDGDTESELAEHYKGSEKRPALRSVFATLLLAHRTGRPVFSDDRFIREAARSIGIAAFGTLALIDVMAEDGIGVVNADARVVTRQKLAAMRAWGVGLDGDELIASGRQVNYALTPLTAGGLLDRARWRANPSLAWGDVVQFLRAAYAERRGVFGEWVLRALDSAQTALPEMGKAWTLEIMIVVAWSQAVTQDAPDGFFQALLDEAKHVPWWLTDAGYDPVLGSLSKVLILGGAADAGERFAVLRLAVPHLRAADQFAAVLAFAGMRTS
jgi:tetratricopeptide (TPR) repeat protein